MQEELSVAPSGCCASLSGAAISHAEAVELAKVFRALADPIRLRLLNLIAAHEGGEACVCDLVVPFDLTAAVIAHHLDVLHEAGLVTCARRGPWVHYRVIAEALFTAPIALASARAEID